MKTTLFLLSFAPFVVAACSSSSTDATESPTGSPGAAGECSAIAHANRTARLRLVEEAEPAAKGGPLSDGTFVLADVTRYEQLPDDNDFLQQITMRLSGGTADFVVTQTIAGRTTMKRSSSTITTSGTKLTAVDTCPAAATNAFDYSVTADGFLLFGTFLGSRMVEHFVRTE